MLVISIKIISRDSPVLEGELYSEKYFWGKGVKVWFNLVVGKLCTVNNYGHIYFYQGQFESYIKSLFQPLKLSFSLLQLIHLSYFPF